MEQEREIAPIVLTDVYNQYPNLTDKQIKALGYFANGLSLPSVARLVNLPTKDVREWMERSDFREAMGEAQRRAATWSYETQKTLLFLAEEKLQDILLQDYDTATASERREIARTARFIRERSESTTINVNSSGMSGGLYLTDESGEMIAKHLRELEANKTDDIVPEYDMFAMPRSHVLHIDTDYGVLNHNEDDDTYQCHICGKWILQPYMHASQVHGISREEYNKAFRLTPSSIL